MIIIVSATKIILRQIVEFVYLETYNYLYMKSIEESAKDYANQYLSDSEQWIAEDGFIKGVEFAQQWISVEEEFPPNDGIDYLLYNRKWKHPDINPSGIRMGFYNPYLDEIWTHIHYSMYIDEYITEHYAPTHWRPIERK